MIETLETVLLVLACICFGAAAAGISIGRLGLVPLGLLFWALTALIP